MVSATVLARPAHAETETYTTVGASAWVVPANVFSATFEVWGAEGGAGGSGGAGGLGGKTTATIAVTPGTTINLYVGGRGANAGAGGTGGNGDAGGGNGGVGSQSGGGGGGASDVRQGGVGRGNIVVAAGGGGGGGALNGVGGTAGSGGQGSGADGTTGASGRNAVDNGGGGAGATTTAAGAGGTAGANGVAGSAGTRGSGGAGGSGANTAGYSGGGGGGGGWFAGGGGGSAEDTGFALSAAAGGGGGGSGFVTGTATSVTQTTGVAAGNGGNGKIVITYTVSASSAPAASEVVLPSALGTTSVVTHLPVVLPASGIVTSDVTQVGGNCRLHIARGTAVTDAAGAPFTGQIFAPAARSDATVENACLFTSSRGTLLRFTPPLGTSAALTVTILVPAARVLKVDNTTGAITTVAGTASGATISLTTATLGTYGAADVVDLARAWSAPSVTSDIPVRFPGTVVNPALTLTGPGGALTIPSGTRAMVATLNAPYFGKLAPPSATAVSGLVSAATLTSDVPGGLRFDKAVTLSLPLPSDDAALVPVGVGAAGSLTCMSGTLAGSAIATEISATSTYALLGRAKPSVAQVDRAHTAQPGYHARWAGQSNATTLCPAQHVEVSVKLRNTGDLAWIKGTPSQVVLGSNASPGNSRDFERGILVFPLYNTDRFATHAEATVRPGEIGTFTFTLRAPATAGTYTVHLRPVIEGQQWLEDEGIHYDVIVR